MDPYASGLPESLTSLIIEENAFALEARPESVASLVDFFQVVDFRLDAVRQGNLMVPRVLIEKMPDARDDRLGRVVGGRGRGFWYMKSKTEWPCGVDCSPTS